jgi:peptidoglycan-associated lipoprotein
MEGEMRNVIFFMLSAAILLSAIVACDTDSRGAKVSPQTELNPQDEANRGDTYNDPYASDSDSEYGEAVDTGKLDLQTVYFDYDKFNLDPQALDIMSVNADQLWNRPLTVVLIEGHCDERGTEEYNLALGEKRAREVRDYLLKYGISPERLSIISYGESMPAARGTGEKSWSQNRRAEFAVLSR